MIYQKIQKIREELPAIVKDKVIIGSKKYRDLETILKHLRPLLDKYQLICLPTGIDFFQNKPETVKHPKTGELTDIQHVSFVQKFTLVDTEDNTTIELSIPTEGMDQTNQAKATKGAVTTAQRILFEELFLIVQEKEEIEEIISGANFVSAVLVAKDDFMEKPLDPAKIPFVADTPEKKKFLEELIFATFTEKNIHDPHKTLARTVWKEILQKKPTNQELATEIVKIVCNLGN